MGIGAYTNTYIYQCRYNPVDYLFLCCQETVVVSEQCDKGQELNYIVLYTSSSGSVASVTIPSMSCINSECRHTLDVSSMTPTNYTVSVAAVNVVGENRSTESRTISEHNLYSRTPLVWTPLYH